MIIKIEQADTHHIDCSLIHVMAIQISNLFSTLLSFKQNHSYLSSRCLCHLIVACPLVTFICTDIKRLSA